MTKILHLMHKFSIVRIWPILWTYIREINTDCFNSYL